MTGQNSFHSFVSGLVLIVDEVSKVTFSDFIVPALYAKKWILVGDVKQLSLYVENNYVAENIASMLPENEQQAVVKMEHALLPPICNPFFLHYLCNGI